MGESLFNEIRDELREIRALLADHVVIGPDDLVDAKYISRRTGLAERTILEGKAGTRTLQPRVELRDHPSARPLIRWKRSTVDRWIAERVDEATKKDPQRRALKLLQPKKRTRA